MKLWVDDVRTPPDGWVWAKSSDEAVQCLRLWPGFFEEMSLDHDLGGDDTTRPVVLWLCENESYWPRIVFVHSANPPGVTWLRGMIDRYNPHTARS